MLFKRAKPWVANVTKYDASIQVEGFVSFIFVWMFRLGVWTHSKGMCWWAREPTVPILAHIPILAHKCVCTTTSCKSQILSGISYATVTPWQQASLLAHCMRFWCTCFQWQYLPRNLCQGRHTGVGLGGHNCLGAVIPRWIKKRTLSDWLPICAAKVEANENRLSRKWRRSSKVGPLRVLYDGLLYNAKKWQRNGRRKFQL